MDHTVNHQDLLFSQPALLFLPLSLAHDLWPGLDPYCFSPGLLYPLIIDILDSALVSRPLAFDATHSYVSSSRVSAFQSLLAHIPNSCSSERILMPCVAHTHLAV